MKVSIQATWKVEDTLYNPPVERNLSAVGETEFFDVSPPHSRRGMRCGEGYTGGYAKRQNWEGYGRFFLEVQTAPQSGEIGIEQTTDQGTLPLTNYAWASENNSFVSGMYKPWKTQDPAYECANGVWTKSTKFTKSTGLSLRGWIRVDWGLPFFPQTYLGGEVLMVDYHIDMSPPYVDVLLDFNVIGEIARIQNSAQVTWKFFNIDTQQLEPVGTGMISYTINP